ncbi:MFS transporter [Nonomuraea spiralis]|uniref:MFS transporter n=1 Tax=Nonomuraea spiralis TaxID=46182 RepID=A0ABV5IHX8_9ACTN|nr:MFS transporter [Nonomuraea spiralis]
MLTRYMAGVVAARTGDEMSGPALLVAGLAATGSPLLGASLLAGLTVSAAVGGPLLGVLLDRARRPGRLLAGCLLGYAGGLLLVAYGVGRAPGAVLVALAAVTGLAGPALTGGWTGQLPLVSGPDARRLTRATTLDAMSYNVAGLAGPAAVGVVAAVGGGTAAVPVSVALLLIALPAAWTLPAHDVPATAAAPPPVLDGVRVVLRNRVLRRATAGSMVSCAGAGMFVVSAPMLGLELAGDSGRGTLLLAVTAAAGLAANGLLAWRGGPRRWDTTLVRSTALIGLGMAAAAGAGAFAGAYWMAVVAAAMVGAGEGPQLTALFAVRQREAPAGLRSQVFTTGASLKITSFAAGSALAGPLSAHAAGAALLAGAALQAVAVAVFFHRAGR